MNESIDGVLPDFTDTDHAGVSHRILGTTMPALEVLLDSGQTVVSQGGELSWMTTNVAMSTKTSGAGGSGLGGVFKRAMAGGTIFMTEYTAVNGQGAVAFATKMPGHIRAVSVDPQREWIVSRHGFLAATPNVTMQLVLQQKLGVGIFSGNGFFMQRLTGQGTAWVELSGEVVTYELAAGESLLAHPGHVGLFEASVSLDIVPIKGVRNMFFGADTLFLSRLTGPGKVYLQTLTLPGLAHSLVQYLPAGETSVGPSLNIGGFKIQ
jgi:uncharacterized protein (AIM24 family)